VLRDLRPTLALALPVIAAEIGWISMGIVDTMIVRALGPAAIGAVGTGSTLFMTLMVLGIGTLFSLDTFVSHAFGAGRIDDCHRWLFAGLYLAAGLSVVSVLIGLWGVTWLPRMGLHPAVRDLLAPYLVRLLWSAPPLLVYTVCRRYLQAMNVVWPVMFSLVTANIVNAVGNWAFVYGRLGMPALGVAGSAYATLAARVYMTGFLIVVIVRREQRRPSGLHDVPLTIDGPRVARLLRLGLPAALQVVLEVGVFGAVSALAARITPVAVAANQIALNVASFFFMVPLGLSSAAAVRVGQAMGRRDSAGARRAGWTAMGIALVYAITMSALFLAIPNLFLRLFTSDVSLLALGALLLAIVAVFQPFDGLQNVTTGALRGLGDTRTPMVLNLIGHWAIGLPLAYWLCFRHGWGVQGLWIGLAAGLMLIGSILVLVWQVESKNSLTARGRSETPDLTRP